jgi:hypothetical protein
VRELDEDSQSTGILVGAVGIEPACKRQPKDLNRAAGKFESLQVPDKQQSDSWNQFLGLTKLNKFWTLDQLILIPGARQNVDNSGEVPKPTQTLPRPPQQSPAYPTSILKRTLISKKWN